MDKGIKRVFIEPFKELGFAKIDLHRERRKGFPEVILCQGKTKTQVLKCASEVYKASGCVLLTRVEKEFYKALKKKFPKGRYFPEAKIFYVGKIKKGKGLVVVLSAGTGDIPVAEEAAITAEILGSRVKRIYDVGTAGIHRLLAFKSEIEKGRVLIVVAGMDGVLPSVVGGLFSKPVIAVPTSIGYGIHLKGLASLLTMLNSCAPGVAVVNIDNGFGAGYLASVINLL
uniref:Nickel pincer cofactor biosynthesis protein LarB n=1 Tax=candidate division WOR-3 bacterium TaxID=2052148 RepID=A0A7C4TI65_UNCW3